MRYAWTAGVLLFMAMAAAAPANLSITELTLRHSEDGQPVPVPVFAAGRTVYMSFRVAGFSARGEDREVELTWTIDALDPAKRPIAETVRGNLKVELAPEDKDWMPKVRYNVQVPPVPEPGMYTIVIALEDKVSGKTVRGEQQFRVEGAAVPRAEALGIANFGFLRSENDRAALPEPATYRPGDVVWARFDVTGYKFGERNRYDVRYGLALQDPAGKKVFSQPQAAADSDEGFYPKRFVTATFSITLDKKVAPGEYTLVVTLTDTVGKQTAESARTFRVEPEK
ncbi:MAG TPA: hypothetical protein VFL57_01460 [Bryobacteraceae bacterium]|nr:hypothetical protein [Bryobacteraceae bacterium]